MFSCTGLAIALACHARPAPAPTPPDSPSLAAVDTSDLAGLRAEVRTLIGDAACTDRSQCRLIGFGAKPCGGPRQYLVYSITYTDSVALTSAIARFNARDAELNRQLHRISDCSLVARPSLVVVDGRCAIGP